jgi:hypothetical protein
LNVVVEIHGGGALVCDIVGRYVGALGMSGVNGNVGVLSFGEIEAYSDTNDPIVITPVVIPPKVNLLKGKATTTSGALGTNLAAANAVDGNNSTDWMTFTCF